MHKLIFDSPQEVARQVAARTVGDLAAALASNHPAVWVLAGGSTPTAAYHVLALDYKDAIDWSKVIVLIGDERCVPLAHPDSNWGQISGFLDGLGISDENRLVPLADAGPEAAAEAYEQVIFQMPHFDVVWLGVGEDGHTLSLFPGRTMQKGRLVAPVHDSPKPPADRITLTYEALAKTGQAYVLATGANKAEAVTQALSGDQNVPIARAANVIDKAGGSVNWLLDQSVLA